MNNDRQPLPTLITFLENALILLNADYPAAKHNSKRLTTSSFLIEPEHVYRGISVYGFVSTQYKPADTLPVEVGDVITFSNNNLQSISKEVFKKYPKDAVHISQMYKVLDEAIKTIPDGKVTLARYTMAGSLNTIFTFSIVRSTSFQKLAGVDIHDLIKITLR